MNLSQFRTMLWLRWRLSRNQWRRGGGLNAAIALLVVVFGTCTAVAGGIAGFAGGALGLAEASPTTNLVVWDVLVAIFVVTWSIGLITELQRSELLDFSRMLHLPVSIKDVFLLNYLASHFSPGVALTLPAMLGLAVGLMIGRGAAMILLLPLVVGFFFMITSWTYCLRGWLAALMVNKRRRRAIVMGVTMAFILLMQLPNLLTQLWIHNEVDREPPPPVQMPAPVPQVEWSPGEGDPQPLPELPEAPRLLPVEAPTPDQAEAEGPERLDPTVETAHRWVPLLWLPHGAWALAEGRIWPAVWGAVGMLALGAWGLVRGYRGTIRFYQGGETNRPVKKKKETVAADKAKPAGKPAVNMVERTLPGVPEPAAATAMASLRSMWRAPEIKMALATNVLIFLVLGGTVLFRGSHELPDAVRPLLAAVAVALTFLGLTQVMANQFGFDRSGFRTYVLLPTERRHILLGRNLAIVPLALVIFSIYLVAVTLLARLGFLDVLAALVVFVIGMLVTSMLGNLVSILVPYRISAGSLKPTKTDMTTALLVILSHMASMTIILPVFVPALVGLLVEHTLGLSGSLITLACAVVLTAVCAGVYWLSLGPLGKLLQSQEKRILRIVTKEVE